MLSPSIFKAYDIRGIVGKTLDSEIAYRIGRAFGTTVLVKGETEVVIGRDGQYLVVVVIAWVVQKT